MQNLEHEIKEIIISSLDLEDITPEDINSTDPLFGDGLGLDSIDALELGLALKKAFSIQLNANTEESKQQFYSVATLAKFVQEQKVNS